VQISNSMQSINNTLVYETKKVEEEQQQKELEKQNSQKANGYNTTSKLYRELSEDVSQYSTANPTQDRIDEDVLNTLSKYQDGSIKDFLKFNIHLNGSFVVNSEASRENALESATSEKTKKFIEILDNFVKENREFRSKYGNELTSEVSSLAGGEFTKDEFEKKMNLLYNRFSEELVDNAIRDNEALKIKYNNLFASLKSDNPLDDLTMIGEGFIHYNLGDKEDVAILEERKKQRFQNIYRFSDEFAKTEKFIDLYKEYKEEMTKTAKEANSKGDFNPWSYIYNFDMFEVEKADIIGKGYSKNEWIESIDKSKTLLEDTIKDNPNMMDKVKIEMKDNIKFYENILTDLKELWQYGDFKADG